MSEFLTPAELEDLTGLKQPAAQARWLRKEKIRVRRRADGALRVLWDDVKARPREAAPIGRTQPNFEVLHAGR